MKSKYILWVVLVCIVLSGAAYYFVQYKDEIVSSIMTGESSGTAATSTNTYAYVTALKGNQITLDYIEIYYGDVAIAKLKEDGRCLNNSCDTYLSGPPIYYRNNNTLLRMLTLAPDVQIVSRTKKTMSLEDLASSISYLDDKGQRTGEAFEISFNSKGEVSKIEEVFRP